MVETFTHFQFCVIFQPVVKAFSIYSLLCSAKSIQVNIIGIVYTRLQFCMLQADITYPIRSFTIGVDCSNFYRAKQLCQRCLGDRNSVRLFVRPSICLSVTCVLCDVTIEHTADILIPHERVIILFLDTNGGWWVMSPST